MCIFRYRHRWTRFRFEERGRGGCGVFRQRGNICTWRKINLCGQVLIAVRLSVLEISKCKIQAGFHLHSIVILAIVVVVIVVVDSCSDRAVVAIISILWIMSDNGQSPHCYYQHNVRVQIVSACPALRKRRRYRNNSKFYHIPYRIVQEKIIVLLIIYQLYFTE